MNEAVVDCSLAIDVVLGTALLPSEWSSSRLVAPTWFGVEVRAVLSRFVRTGRLTAETCESLLAEIDALALDEIEPDARRTWDLACGHLGYYDARYVALAEELDCRLWTTDTRLDHPVVEFVGRG